MISAKTYDFFIGADMSSYTGEWIAVANTEVISHGKSVRDVLADAEKKAKGKKFMVTRIPGKETMIL